MPSTTLPGSVFGTIRLRWTSSSTTCRTPPDPNIRNLDHASKDHLPHGELRRRAAPPEPLHGPGVWRRRGSAPTALRPGRVPLRGARLDGRARDHAGDLEGEGAAGHRPRGFLA